MVQQRNSSTQGRSALSLGPSNTTTTITLAALCSSQYENGSSEIHSQYRWFLGFQACCRAMFLVQRVPPGPICAVYENAGLYARISGHIVTDSTSDRDSPQKEGCEEKPLWNCGFSIYLVRYPQKQFHKPNILLDYIQWLSSTSSALVVFCISTSIIYIRQRGLLILVRCFYNSQPTRNLGV